MQEISSKSDNLLKEFNFTDRYRSFSYIYSAEPSHKFRKQAEQKLLFSNFHKILSLVDTKNLPNFKYGLNLIIH